MFARVNDPFGGQLVAGETPTGVGRCLRGSTSNRAAASKSGETPTGAGRCLRGLAEIVPTISSKRNPHRSEVCFAKPIASFGPGIDGPGETPTEVGPPSLTTKLSRFLPPL